MEYNYDIEYYQKFRHFVKWFMHTFYNIEAEGLENIPDSSYILSGNHLNILDSWLLLALIDENLRFMVDKKLYRYKSWKNFFTRLGTFSIDPEKLDIKALKNLYQLIHEEEKIVVFPEGKTHSIKEEVPFKPGIPKVSAKLGTPIIPFGIVGSYRPFTKLKISIGSPINYKIANIPKEEIDAHLEQEVRLLQKKAELL